MNNQTQVFSDGEVAELVDALRADAECAEVEHYDLCNMTADQMRRAADLLEQRQAAPVPVAVTERLPQPKDCDVEGRCWWWDGEWGLIEQRFTDCHITHWLPAQTLPLPGMEVE